MSQRWTQNLLELELYIRTVYSGTGLCRKFIFLRFKHRFISHLSISNIVLNSQDKDITLFNSVRLIGLTKKFVIKKPNSLCIFIVHNDYMKKSEVAQRKNSPYMNLQPTLNKKNLINHKFKRVLAK